jgi:hypothetical protein
MFVGDVDTLADPYDAEWTRNIIGDAVKHYKTIHGGHATFLVGKDMTWFTNDVM